MKACGEGSWQAHSWACNAFVSAVCMLLVFSRKPDALLGAQFWAEDGAVWYRQAYEFGWKALLLPQNGYFQSISKLTALLSLSVRLTWAPLVFSAVAIAFKVLPVVLLNSSRGRALVPDSRARLLLCTLYIGHPYSWEVFANVTNIHWHLALATLLVLCFDSWHGPWRKLLDISITALCGLSGTFALFLAPIAVWYWRRTGSRRSLLLAALLVAAALIQLVAILNTGVEGRSAAPLGATWGMLPRIFGGQIAAAGVLGDNWSWLFTTRWWQGGSWLPLLLSVLTMGVLVRAFLGSNHLLRGLIVFAGMVFIAALINPQISNTEAQWPLFARPEIGGRYVFIAIIALHASLLWMATKDECVACRWLAASTLALVVVVGIPTSWKVRPYQDLEFAAHAARFEAAPAGTVVEIPINPPGWSFRLRKKED